MWEIMTRGRMPYEDMDNCAVMTYVKRGKRLQQPAVCPDGM